MRAVCGRDTHAARWPLGFYARRHYQVIQRGHDRPRESLYDKLGFSKDNEARRVRRTPAELQQGLLRQVEALKDPVQDPKDKKRLAELKEAYTLLHSDHFRATYGGHYYASNDAQLHVLCDGGQVAANFNPEHREFTYIDHAIDRDSGSSSEKSEERAGQSTRSGSSAHASSTASASFAQNNEAPTADAFRDAFRNATGVGSGPSGATAATAHAFNAAAAANSMHGGDVHHLLRISLEQSLYGCDMEMEIQRQVQCDTCHGSGRQRLGKLRKCPQCLGRGSTHIPSATYHVERRCLFCGGEGTVPPPVCRTCAGRGVHPPAMARVKVTVPPGTASNTLFKLPHYGHDGARGGRAGALLVTVLVREHRYFYRHKTRQKELHAVLPLPLSIALLGGRVEVPTLTGHRGFLHVPPCVWNGQVLPYDVYGVRPFAASRATGIGDRNESERNHTAASVDSSGRDVAADETASSTSLSRVFFHVLVMIPKVEDLSGRQRAALHQYDIDSARTLHGREEQSRKEETEAADHEVEITEARPVPQQTHTTAEGDGAALKPPREDLMKECAALKMVYRHWFTSN